MYDKGVEIYPLVFEFVTDQCLTHEMYDEIVSKGVFTFHGPLFQDLVLNLYLPALVPNFRLPALAYNLYYLP